MIDQSRLRENGACESEGNMAPQFFVGPFSSPEYPKDLFITGR